MAVIVHRKVELVCSNVRKRGLKNPFGKGIAGGEGCRGHRQTLLTERAATSSYVQKREAGEGDGARDRENK